MIVKKQYTNRLSLFKKGTKIIITDKEIHSNYNLDETITPLNKCFSHIEIKSRPVKKKIFDHYEWIVYFRYRYNDGNASHYNENTYALLTHKNKIREDFFGINKNSYKIVNEDEKSTSIS